MEFNTVETAVDRVFGSFERLLRVLYPGLLFWLLLPPAVPSGNVAKASLDIWTNFYTDISIWGHIGIVLAGGLFFHIVERYLFHETLLAFFLVGWKGFGPAVNFRSDRAKKFGGISSNNYWNSNGEYQGTVRLRMEATDSVQTVISFVNTLRQKLHVRILELSGTVAGGVDVRLALRNPLDLISVLRQIEGVSKVEGPKGQGECGPLVHVQLAEDIGVS